MQFTYNIMTRKRSIAKNTPSLCKRNFRKIENVCLRETHAYSSTATPFYNVAFHDHNVRYKRNIMQIIVTYFPATANAAVLGHFAREPAEEQAAQLAAQLEPALNAGASAPSSHRRAGLPVPLGRAFFNTQWPFRSSTTPL